MNEQLDYAEMLEIPVNTVNVVKKKSIFKRKKTQPQEESREELKDAVVDSVNERVGAYVYAEDLSDPPKPEKKRAAINFGDRGGTVLIAEMVAVVVLAFAIFITNFFLPNTVINTFITSLMSDGDAAEPTYNELTLSAVTSALSDAEVSVSSSGVISFQAEGCVYPVYGGKVASVSSSNGLYTVRIDHTSTFSSVITGLSTVYSAVGTTVAVNVPFGYSDGANAVNVSMYDGETLLNCYTLAGEVPVWNT